ncbi:hypothetical protein BJ322DRAFT_1022909 [Thelephora terrestris]|uniref:Uncharacterized protein n=1 Tax=Thelephora terrestris TaxID=56493 RepID=A0A9P6H8S2_9AGAM|nr:hypothetical protein BJ322DRAFT_1022909 [Thelephora terrestris]
MSFQLPVVTANEMGKAEVGLAICFINPELVASVMLPEVLQTHNQATVEYFLTAQAEAEARLAAIDVPTGVTKPHVNVRSVLKATEGNHFSVFPVISEPLFPQFEHPKTPANHSSTKEDDIPMPNQSNTWNVLLVKIPQKTRGIIREHVSANLHTKIPPTWPSVAPGRLVLVIWKLRVRVRFTIGNELGVRVILQSRPLTATTPRSRHELRTRSVSTDNSHVLIELVAPDLNNLIINGNQPVLMTDQQTSGRRLGPIGNYRQPGPMRNLKLLFFNSDLRLVTPPLKIPDFSGQFRDTTSKANLKE